MDKVKQAYFNWGHWENVLYAYYTPIGVRKFEAATFNFNGEEDIPSAIEKLADHFYERGIFPNINKDIAVRNALALNEQAEIYLNALVNNKMNAIPDFRVKTARRLFLETLKEKIEA